MVLKGRSPFVGMMCAVRLCCFWKSCLRDSSRGRGRATQGLMATLEGIGHKSRACPPPFRALSSHASVSRWRSKHKAGIKAYPPIQTIKSRPTRAPLLGSFFCRHSPPRSCQLQRESLARKCRALPRLALCQVSAKIPQEKARYLRRVGGLIDEMGLYTGQKRPKSRP